jgi:hypothetical protein
MGAAASVWMLSRSEQHKGGRSMALLAIPLWPFLLPMMMPGEAQVPVVGGSGPHSARIDDLALRLRDSWTRSGATEERERRLLEGFVQRLRDSAGRLQELDRAIPTALPSVGGKLQELRRAEEAELEQSLSLLEEVVAHLTLLRFVGPNRTGSRFEQVKIEDLLLRIESLADVSRAS